MKLAGVDVNCKVLFRVKIFADLFYFYYSLQNCRRFCEFRLQIWTCIKNELGIKMWSLPISILMYVKSGRRLMVSPTFFSSKLFFVASRIHWLFGCWYSQMAGFLYSFLWWIILLKYNFKTMQFFPTYFPFFYDE